MKLTLAEPRYLKDSISVISELVSETRLKINADAVELIAMDPANVAMVVFKLLSSCFTEYSIEKDTEVAINLGNLKQILRRTKSNDMLTLELKDNKLKITLKGNNTRTFYLPTINFEEREQNVPELSFPITINTQSSVLVEAIEDVDIVADSVAFVAEQGKLTIKAEGDLSRADIEMKENDVTKIESKEKNPVTSKYSIEYLKKIVAGGKLADNVTVSFNKDYPLKVDFKEIDKVLLSFILAPRVENE